MARKYNCERHSWRGRSRRKRGKRVRELRDKAVLKTEYEI